MDLTTKEVFTFDEACAYTGISKSYMYKLTSGNRIPCSKPTGKKLYFNRVQLEKWLTGNPAKTTDQIQVEAANSVMFRKRKGVQV